MTSSANSSFLSSSSSSSISLTDEGCNCCRSGRCTSSLINGRYDFADGSPVIPCACSVSTSGCAKCANTCCSHTNQHGLQTHSHSAASAANANAAAVSSEPSQSDGSCCHGNGATTSAGNGSVAEELNGSTHMESDADFMQLAIAHAQHPQTVSLPLSAAANVHSSSSISLDGNLNGEPLSAHGISDDPVLPQKRKRGRPRKIRALEAELSGKQTANTIGLDADMAAISSLFVEPSTANSPLVSIASSSTGSITSSTTVSDDPRRERHKEADRLRRDKLRQGFEQLRQLTHLNESAKPDQAMIVAQSVELIQSMQQEIAALRAKVQSLTLKEKVVQTKNCNCGPECECRRPEPPAMAEVLRAVPAVAFSKMPIAVAKPIMHNAAARTGFSTAVHMHNNMHANISSALLQSSSGTVSVVDQKVVAVASSSLPSAAAPHSSVSHSCCGGSSS